jgi:predicted metal-binding protein
VRLADRDAVRFLRGCEADGMKLENCPAYVREWMDTEKIERTTKLRVAYPDGTAISSNRVLSCRPLPIS